MRGRGRTGRQAYVRANVECFVALLESLRVHAGVPLVYASSSSVYGANTKIPFSEADRVDAPSSLYAATKKADEAIAHVYHGLYGVPVRTPPRAASARCKRRRKPPHRRCACRCVCRERLRGLVVWSRA
eukprot:561887-Prymnesium_polylepis.1